jgi:hypothetical protein
LQLCQSPLCLETGFCSEESANSFLHISYFPDDPSAGLSLKIVAQLFDHSDEVMLAFENIDFANRIWKLFSHSSESEIRYLALQVLNRWMHRPNGSQRIYEVYLKAVKTADRQSRNAISEGIYQFVQGSPESASYAVQNRGMLFCANQICYGIDEARHFAVKIAVRLLSLGLNNDVIDSFMQLLAKSDKDVWPFMRARSVRECSDTVELVVMLHQKFENFPRYLLEKGAERSLMEIISEGIRKSCLEAKIALFELVAFWMNHSDETFILAFFEAYSVQAFLDDLEEFGQGRVLSELMKGIEKLLEKRENGGIELLKGGLIDTLGRMSEDEFGGDEAQGLLTMALSWGQTYGVS